MPLSDPSNNSRNTLLALILLALGFRLLFLLAMPRVLDTADAIHYVETAEAIARGGFLGYDPKIPPLYPALGAIAHVVISDLEWACRLVSLIASALTILPVFLLARDLHGPKAAQAAGLIVVFWPWLADYACRVSTEATAVFFWFSALYFLARGLRHGGWMLYLAPFAFFALTLTRAEGLFILLCTLPAAALLYERPDKPFVRRYAGFACISLALVALNTLYIRVLTGATTANYRVGFILNEFDYLRFVQTAVQSVSDVLPVMLGPILFLFIGVGFFQARERRRDLRLEGYVLLFAAAQWAISLFVLSPAPRYLMTTLIALSLWSACGIVLVTARLRSKGCPPWLAQAPIAALLGFFLLHATITVGSEHLGRRPREPREYKAAGQWMAANLEPGLIFTRKPQVGYYAKMPSTGPALTDSLDEALVRARDAKAAYFVVDERYTATLAPSLRVLLDAESATPGLKHLKTEDSYPDSRVVIYAILPESEVARTVKRSTLVVHTGGIGDLICTFPAIQSLQADSAIELAGIPERIALARAAGIATATHDLDRIGFHSVFGSVDERLRSFAEDFDRAIVFMKDDDGAIARGLGEAGIGDVCCIPGIPPTDAHEHAAHWYARALGVSISLPVQFDFGTATNSLEVVIQPGSGSPKKNWPLESFQCVAAKLTEQGYGIHWCLGPAEEGMENLEPRLPDLSLTALAQRLSRTQVFIGNDSGIGHLAAVTGCPTVSIFGPTDPRIWRPIGPRSVVAQGEPWPSWEAILDKSLDFLGD